MDLNKVALLLQWRDDNHYKKGVTVHGSHINIHFDMQHKITNIYGMSICMV